MLILISCTDCFLFNFKICQSILHYSYITCIFTKYNKSKIYYKFVNTSIEKIIKTNFFFFSLFPVDTDCVNPVYNSKYQILISTYIYAAYIRTSLTWKLKNLDNEDFVRVYGSIVERFLSLSQNFFFSFVYIHFQVFAYFFYVSGSQPTGRVPLVSRS